MKIKTYRSAEARLLGTLSMVEEDSEAHVELEATGEMAMDEIQWSVASPYPSFRFPIKG